MGFLREILMAKELGASAVCDAIKVAIKLPSLFRRIFAEGAFNASFVPFFSELLAPARDPNDALSFAEHILSWLVCMLITLVIIAEIFMPTFIQLVCPHFDAARLDLTIQYTRITFPFILFISLTAFYSGILNSLGKFVFVASSPMVGNIFIVVFVFTLNILHRDPAVSFSIAVLGCGIIQLLWVFIPTRHYGYRTRLRRLSLTPRVKQFFMKVMPAAFGAGVVQINILVDMMIASRLPSGYISYLDFAERLNQLPLSVIGTAISTVLLPLLSRYVANNQTRDAISVQEKSIQMALLLALPCALSLMILAEPVVAVVFEHGKFSITDTHQTARALVAFASGLPAYILIKIFSTTFFAHKDTKTPLKIAGGCVLLNFVLNIILVRHFQHVGLAVATSIAAWCNAGLLVMVLWRQHLFIVTHTLKKFLFQIFTTSLLSIPFFMSIKYIFINMSNTNYMIKFITLGGALVSGFGIFAIIAWLSGAWRLTFFTPQPQSS